jgi:MSHA biogenesis protein MshO
MSRDVRLAVPNSLRISADGQAFELLETLSAQRYRPNRLGGQGIRLSTAAAGSCGSTTASTRCDSVQVLQPSLNLVGVNWLVLYNTGAESAGVPLAGSNLWAPADPGVISPTGSSFSVLAGAPAGESEVAVNLPSGVSSFDFAFASPQRRLYFAGEVIGYRCQGGQLLRYSYHQLLASVPASPPAGSQPLANSVSVCRFNYQAGTTQRAGLLSLTLGLSQAGESVELMQQVHVDNAP